LKIKKILISQPKPDNEKSPYIDLALRNNVCVEFRPFTEVSGVSGKEFRATRIDILKHTAVIFTSKTAVDHFFRICEEIRICVPETMKYFCVTESIALYLQKYIIYRKRKIFFGKNDFADMIDILKKHSGECFLLPSSDSSKKDNYKLLEKNKINYTRAILYHNVTSNLTDLTSDFDMFVFFSPSGVKALFDNFPRFKQNGIRIASFGPNTAKAVKDAGLKLDIKAPTPEAPSMAMAIEQYIQKLNKSNGRN